MPETVEISKGETSVLSLSLCRVAGGIEVTAKSAVLEAFFAARSAPSNGAYDSVNSGVNLYGARGGLENEFGMNLSASNSLLSNGEPCLWMLRAKGLGTDGVKVVVNHVASKTAVREFMEKATARVKTFYSEFVRPLTVSIEIRAKEIDGGIVL